MWSSGLFSIILLCEVVNTKFMMLNWLVASAACSCVYLPSRLLITELITCERNAEVIVLLVLLILARNISMFAFTLHLFFLNKF